MNALYRAEKTQYGSNSSRVIIIYISLTYVESDRRRLWRQLVSVRVTGDHYGLTSNIKRPIIIITSKEPVCPRVELILKIIIIVLIIFLGFIKSKPC